MYYMSDGKLTLDGLECKTFYILDLTHVDNVIASEINRLNIVDLLKRILKNVVTVKVCYACVKMSCKEEKYEYIIVVEGDGKYDVYKYSTPSSLFNIVDAVSVILRDYYGWKDKKFVLDLDKEKFVKQVISEVTYSLHRMLEKDLVSRYMDEFIKAIPS